MQAMRALPRAARGMRAARALSSSALGPVRVRTSLRTAKAPLVELSNQRPITWYACGPTVYDVSHIGHARNYVATDILRRILCNHFNYDVKFALGMTDVDDKIIIKGKQAQCQTMDDFLQLATRYEMDYYGDMDRLGVMRPHATLRVTEHIPDIVRFIEQLIAKGHAYESNDGVYFKITSLPTGYIYDKFGNAASGEGVVASDMEVSAGRQKQDNRDFALWKRVPEGEPVGWHSPFGFGRPGWHIECSAVTHAYFGPTIDIHSGGLDLKFPHHTNEIVQSECHHCAPGEDWVKLWIHTGHLHIEGRKMSKSLKNFISIGEFLSSGVTSAPATDFRIFCLQHKYSALLTYTPQHVQLAEQFRRRVLELFSLIDVMKATVEVVNSGRGRVARRPTQASRAVDDLLRTTRDRVTEALASDFDTPLALYHVNNLVTDSQKYLSIVKQEVFGQLSGQSDATVSSAPLEPLLAVQEYIKTLFARSFGVQLSIELTLTTGEGAAAVGAGDGMVDAAVDMRARVRSLAINTLKVLKGRDSATADEVGALCKQLLQECDVARERFAKDGGVKVEDLAVGHTKWSRQS